MQASDDKSWERFIDKVMQEAEPEKLTGDFTENVLGALDAIENAPLVSGYKAPISRMTWLVLGVVFAGVLVWSSLGSTSLQWGWTSRLSTYLDIGSLFEELTLPALEYTSLYSIGLFALFVLLQLVYMKRLFDRRFGLEG
ncbi:hypothetical protein LVD13_00815 [Flavobacteriaceae bacterium D16]|nr:hypothetical protein [Flavobacteriaceae bacterium D16]